MAFPAVSQAAVQQYETWLGGFFTGPISGKFVFQGDLHYRAFPDFSPNWVLVRPAIGYQVAPGTTLSLGYAWTPSWKTPDLSFDERIDEQRVFEQWQYEFPISAGGAKLHVRSRMEERFRPAVAPGVGLRFRQLVRGSQPLSEAWLLAVWDELFFNFNTVDWGQTAGFDQNRAFLGVGYVVVPKTFRLEVGYFNQYIHRPTNSAGDLITHAAMMNGYFSWN